MRRLSLFVVVVLCPAAGGAVTNVILKSGTNTLHGAAYEFNRVSVTAAGSF